MTTFICCWECANAFLLIFSPFRDTIIASIEHILMVELHTNPYWWDCTADESKSRCCKGAIQKVFSLFLFYLTRAHNCREHQAYLSFSIRMQQSHSILLNYSQYGYLAMCFIIITRCWIHTYWTMQFMSLLCVPKYLIIR